VKSQKGVCACAQAWRPPRAARCCAPPALGASWRAVHGGARRRADLLADNPFNTLKLGCDFLRHHALPQIDFATAHLCALGAVRLCSFARERRTAPTKT